MTIATPHYGHQPIKMNQVSGFDAVEKVGDFYWDDKPWEGEASDKRYLCFAAPTSPTNKNADRWVFQRLPVERGANQTGKHWGWDGNEELPTLTPSVHTIGHWHGFVRSGELVEA